MSQKIFYVQVIEAREVASRFPGTVVTPGVVVKYNGSKKSTGYKSGKTYWAEIFTFPIDNVHQDSITFQLREKGYHVVSSDWIGEVKLKLSDFDDGNVHLKWLRLTNGTKQHSKAPKGVLLLKIHLTTRADKPFYKKPCERQLSYDEWIEWSESQYANKHTSGSSSGYPMDGSLPRSRSGSIANDGQTRRDNFARNRSQSVSSAYNGRKDNDTDRRMAKSAETANSDGEASDSSSSDSPPSEISKKFPISPLTDSPPVHPTAKKITSDLLIDLSTPELGKKPAVFEQKKSTNPFSADVMSLSDNFASTNLAGKAAPTGNPFLDPTPEISRVPRPHEAY